ncbi:MAG: secretion protein HlyD [Phycisphaerae bacterium]|nr:secretion protein HlyD [Phycisphaerae bacterium]|tara:strand:+ start:283 stop:1362 length:1080 start_codon:yes stop_codon:yes gene_type:complete
MPTDQGESKSGAKPLLSRIISMAIWIGSAVSCFFVILELVTYPRTSDAFIRANTVGVAAHVSGNIVEFNIEDNQQVSAGDLLFVVDTRPYEAVVERLKAKLLLTDLEVEAYRQSVLAAEAVLEEAVAEADYAIAHHARLVPLLEQKFVTPDEVQKASSMADAASGRVAAANAELIRAKRLVGDEGEINVRRREVEASLADAELNLSYCYVRAPVDGYVSNLNIARGQYANKGVQLFTVVDDSRWYVLANYRETLLRRIEPGMVAEVWLLACPGQSLRGVVQGVGKAIYQPVGASVDALPDVPPSLDWVRLAQRFPVRIVLEDAPDCSLHSGGTATVRILPDQRAGQPRDGILEDPLSSN